MSSIYSAEDCGFCDSILKRGGPVLEMKPVEELIGGFYWLMRSSIAW